MTYPTTINNNSRVYFGAHNYSNATQMVRKPPRAFVPSPLGRHHTNRSQLPTAYDDVEPARPTQTKNINQNKSRNRGGCYKAMGATLAVTGLAAVGSAMYLHYAPNEQVDIHPNIVMGLGIGGLMPLCVGLVLTGMGISKSP